MSQAELYSRFLEALDDAELIRETSMRLEHSPVPSLLWSLIDLCLAECKRRDAEAGNRVLCGAIKEKHALPIAGL